MEGSISPLASRVTSSVVSRPSLSELEKACVTVTAVLLTDPDVPLLFGVRGQRRYLRRLCDSRTADLSGAGGGSCPTPPCPWRRSYLESIFADYEVLESIQDLDVLNARYQYKSPHNPYKLAAIYLSSSLPVVYSTPDDKEQPKP